MRHPKTRSQLLKHILDYRGFIIFKQSEGEYTVKLDTPDGLLPLKGSYRTCLEAVIGINQGLSKVSQSPKPRGIYKFFVDIFNISG
jgi:hypothetical protein